MLPRVTVGGRGCSSSHAGYSVLRIRSLAGVSITDLQVLTNLTPTNVAVEQGGTHPGQPTATTGAPNARVAMGTDSTTFRVRFMAAFTVRSATR
jgi:hypothetical protein